MRIPQKAKAWVKAMKATKDGPQILVNIENDENVPEKIVAKFFRLLCKGYKASVDPIEHMALVLVSMSDSVLQGPEARVGYKLLTRFSPLARLGDNSFLHAAGINLPMLEKIPELVDVIKKIHVGNRRDIVWVADGDAVGRDLRNGVPVAEVIDRLGLMATMEESMYRVSYSANDIDGECHVPTTLDAGGDARFRSAGKGATSGETVPVSGKGKGYSEYVHEACTVEKPGIVVYTMDNEDD